jgi:hypothetical protein
MVATRIVITAATNGAPRLQRNLANNNQPPQKKNKKKTEKNEIKCKNDAQLHKSKMKAENQKKKHICAII